MFLALSGDGAAGVIGTGKGVRARKRRGMHNILICSANEDLLMTLRAASDGGDVRLTVCHRGMDAVRALMALSFDRLILDLETPGLDGPFLVSIARRLDPHLPVVAVSRGPVVQAREIRRRGSRTIWCPCPPTLKSRRGSRSASNRCRRRRSADRVIDACHGPGSPDRNDHRASGLERAGADRSGIRGTCPRVCREGQGHTPNSLRTRRWTAASDRCR